jgi:chemotaxis protein methyltransferase CheR
MRISDFELYKELVGKRSGLVLTPDKIYLLDSRLTPVAKKWGYPSLEAMTLALRGVADKNLVEEVVEAMTTNETSFFRDRKPFDMFQDYILPRLMETRKSSRRIRIWCAAASTGQEPYTLAMILKENEKSLSGWKTEIIATDISKEVLKTAKEGIYTQFEVQRGLPIQYLMKYFVQQGEKWKLCDEIKNMVKFDCFNLLENPAQLGKFDIIFCRNVLIYFDEQTKKMVLENITGLLPEDGFLMLGGAETVLGITDKFKPLTDQRGIYVLSESENSLNTVATA